MPLHVRSIAINMAVVSFFTIAAIGGFCGLAAFTCCKRALIGAALAYITTACMVKIVNAILINAMVDNQMNQQKEQTRDTEN